MISLLVFLVASWAVWMSQLACIYAWVACHPEPVPETPFITIHCNMDVSGLVYAKEFTKALAAALEKHKTTISKQVRHCADDVRWAHYPEPQAPKKRKRHKKRGRK
jgi:hypothetical protein